METRVQQGFVNGDASSKSAVPKGGNASNRKPVRSLEPAEKVQMSKSNVLLIGPTGAPLALCVPPGLGLTPCVHCRFG